MDLRFFQERIRAMYQARDERRGLDRSFVWFVEEVGELARALRNPAPETLRQEFSDVLAWLVTLANLSGIDVADAAARYANGCPRCGGVPCGCPMR